VLLEGNPDNFALVGPLFGCLAQVRSYRIHPHILPFLRITFARWLLAFPENLAQRCTRGVIPAHAVDAAARRSGS
jgi:hypothetical protein